MPHIELSNDYPGIRSLFIYRPETAAPLNTLVQTLLLDPQPGMSAGERELIATYVSSLNKCTYCMNIHGAIARHQLKDDTGLVARVIKDLNTAGLSGKMKALLEIAAQVQSGGKCVLPEHISRARSEGASDVEIHDTVLIAAAFCMYNRYVDGLATWQPDPQDKIYEKMGEQRAREGYLTPPLKAANKRIQ